MKSEILWWAMVGKVPKNRKNPQNFKDFTLFYRFLWWAWWARWAVNYAPGLNRIPDRMICRKSIDFFLCSDCRDCSTDCLIDSDSESLNKFTSISSEIFTFYFARSNAYHVIISHHLRFNILYGRF